MIAVIARTNGQIKEFSNYLEIAKIPYKLITNQDGYFIKIALLFLHIKVFI